MRDVSGREGRTPSKKPSTASRTHYHTLVLGGVYVKDEAGELHLHDLGDPTPEEIAQVAAWTHARLVQVLERHGRSLDASDDAPDVHA